MERMTPHLCHYGIVSGFGRRKSGSMAAMPQIGPGASNHETVVVEGQIATSWMATMVRAKPTPF